MADKQTSKDRMREIVDRIETGIKELFESDKYRQYLSTMSRFHRYSVNNTMLIYMQKPDATLVAGFNKWRDQFGRNVMKGEKSIKIIAPTPYKKKIEEVKLDPDTKAPMLDADGKVVTEEKEVKIPMYKVVSVFDVSQTDGKPLPQLASDLSGNVQQYEIFMEALRRSSPVPMEIRPIAGDTDGYFNSADQSIAIRDGMSEVQTVCAAVHEIAHAKLHNYKKVDEPKDAPKYQEVEIFDVPGLFSNGRIALADLPEGLYRYDLRGSDYDPGMPVTVEPNVVVNHAGAVITAKPLALGEDDRLYLTEEEGLNFVGGEISVYQFLNEQRKDRYTEEVEAESVSYAVCQYFGIETAENSFGYIATWSQGKELKELRTSLETINKTASGLITDIDRHFAEICKERGIDPQSKEQTQIPGQVAESLSPFLTQKEITVFSNDFAALMVKVNEAEPGQSIPAADEAGIAAWADERIKNHDLRPLSDALLDVYKIVGEDGQPRFTEQDALMDRLAQLNQREFVPTAPEPAAEQPEPVRYEYKLHSNFNRTTPDDNTYIQQYTVTKDSVLVPGDVLYVGAYEKCLELQVALRSGTMTPEQVKALEQSEKLYLVSDSTYLHIQRSDGGFDYTLYDKESMRLLDGGQLDNPDILLSTACMEICKLHDLDTYAVRLASLDMLEPLQEAQKVPVPIVGEDMENAADDGTATAPASMLPDSPEQAMDEPLPDPTITPQMMEYFGYTDSDMLPLSKDRAMELAEKDITVYMLYADNTEAMVFDTEDVVNHDGLFGISREDWEAIKADIPLRDVEQRFLDSPTDSMAIYQLRRDAPVELRFARMENLSAPPDPANYEAVYTREVYPDSDRSRTLENFHYIFNEERPADFTGHSLSVSDIVALKQDGKVSYHYCDSVGFKELPAFQRPENHLKAAEMSMEDDYGMIDGIINNGKAADRDCKEKKPSVLEQLRSQPVPERSHKTAPKKSAEREI